MSRYRIVDNEHDRVTRYVAQKNSAHWFPGNVGIGLERAGQLIAGVSYDSYCGRSICMHAAIDRLNRDILWYAFYYPFVQLGVKKVIGLVDSTNEKALRLDLHLGFTLEAVIADGAKYGDLRILTMTRDQCRWLNAVRRPGVKDGWQERRA